MNFLDIFKKNTTVDSTGILSEPGDKLEARVTNSNRKVVKIQKDNGNSKYSAHRPAACRRASFRQ